MEDLALTTDGGAPPGGTRRLTALELDVILRDFRRDELANRRPPTTRAVVVDAAPRFVALGSTYVVMLLAGRLPAVAAAGAFAVVAFSLVGSWFHEAIHQNLTARPFLDTVARRVGAAPFALSPLWWIEKHVRSHHPKVGDPDLDLDIQFGVVARVREGQRWRLSHTTQHIHFPILMAMATLAMLAPRELISRNFARASRSANSTSALLVDKYLGWVVVWLPLLLLRGVWQATVCFAVFHLVGGVLAGVVVQSQHNTALCDGVERSLGACGLATQLIRSADVGQRRGIWWWISGGTTFHVVHHLTPQLSFLETPAATARLRSRLAKVGMSVPTHASMRSAMKSHRALLRRLSRAEGNA